MDKLFCLFGSHEAPQVEINNAHDNSVWDLAWHPVGYLLCRYWAVYFQILQLTLFLIYRLLCFVLHIDAFMQHESEFLLSTILSMVWPYSFYSIVVYELIKRCFLFFWQRGQ